MRKTINLAGNFFRFKKDEKGLSLFDSAIRKIFECFVLVEMILAGEGKLVVMLKKSFFYINR